METDTNTILPVIFIHEGNQEYLKIAIESASIYNNNVILVGDESNKMFCDKWYNINDLVSKEYGEFKELYRHMSSNRYEFELICFKRYFILKKIMEEIKEENAIMLDSDILTYINFSNCDFTKYYCGLSINMKQNDYRWSVSPHCSFWSIEAINDFTKYCIDTYSNNIEILNNKYNYHKERSIKGGICDMTLLYLWSKNKKNIFNICVNRNNETFDHCLSSSENYFKNEYQLNRILGIKKVIIKDGKPFFVNKENQEVKANILHFQGSSKCMMKGIFYSNRKKVYKDRIKFYIRKLYTRLVKSNE